MAYSCNSMAKAGRRPLLSTSAIALILLTFPAAAHAQTSPAATAQDDGQTTSGGAPGAGDKGAASDIVVTGFRSSLARGAELKRNSDQVVDAISSEELGKLPDQNIAEALQRVTGVQIQRSGGEGNKFQIRGSNYNLTLVDGFEVAPDPAFGGATTTPNRQVNLFNYPSALFSDVLVYKSPTASQIEGGVGGTVDLRMPDPLKTPSRTVISGNVGYLNLTKKPSVEAIALTSHRWNNIGILFGVTYFNRDSATDNFAGGSRFSTNSVDINGDGVADPGLSLPFNMTFSRQWNNRVRTTVNGLVSWEPTSNLSMRLEAAYIRQTTDNRRAFIAFNLTNARDVGGSALTTQKESDGSTTFLSGQLRNVLNTQDGLASDEGRSLYQGSFSLSWKPVDRLTLSAAIAGSKTKSKEFFIVYQALQNSITTNIDLRTDVPSVSLVAGGNFNDPSAYKAYVIGVTRNEQSPDLVQGRFDAAYELDGFLRKVSVGVRATQSHFDTATYQTRYQTTFPIGTQFPLTQFPQYVTQFALGNFFNGAEGNYPTNFLDPYVKPTPENGTALLSQIGYTGPLLPLATSSYRIRERTYAAYLQLDWRTELLGRPLSGNIGARYVATREYSASTAITASGAQVPIAYNNNYNDFLPSANVKWELSSKLTARLSASRVISRPPIDSLSAGTTISFSSGLNSASSGQPLLKPFRANQFDVGLEYYFDDGLVSAALFYKDIQSFITTSSIVGATLPGFPGTFFLTAPANGPGGVSKGLEVGFQHNFGFISPAFRDFGALVNYTYVDSSRTGSDLPIELTSKHSLNVIGYYEHGPFQIRVAYNWRSSQYLGISRNVNTYADARGQLDFSTSYDIFKNVSLTLEGIDLLVSPQRAYAGFPDRIDGYQINDRRLFFGVRVRM